VLCIYAEVFTPKAQTHSWFFGELFVKFISFLALLLLGALAYSQNKSASAKSAPAADFTAMADRYFDEYYFKFNPTSGTAAGFHQYDTHLEDYSRASLDQQIALLKKFKVEFTSRVSTGQTGLKAGDEAWVDLNLVLGDIHSRLLELENIRQWEKNPDVYSSGITNSIFVIMARTFAPPEERLRSVIAREKQVPAVFRAARQNLKNPPPIYVDVALEQIPGIISFFEKDVPEAFKDVKDQSLLAEFHTVNQTVMDSLKQYQAWIKKDLKPQAHGDFRIGADNFSKKLLYNEDVDIPLPQLLEIGMANLRKNQEEFKAVAAKIDPNKTPQQILEELEKDHPAPDKLLQTFRDTLGGLRDFLDQQHIVGMPSQVLPIVQETPPFARALTFASMDTPGPFEKVAKEAFFNVTLPEPSWTPQQVEEHMAGFNRGTVISTAVHEVYPGHYTQFLWVPSAPSKVRKLLGCSSNAEGWAHYSEQMMIDEGFHSGDPKYRLAQLQDALLRNVRFIVGIGMHTKGMTVEEATKLFETQGHQPHAISVQEAKRGAGDPLYGYYTMGKLMILKLRRDYEQKLGAAYSLQKFHDAFIQLGPLPLPLVRKAMLGETSGALFN
jgi:uncharacterized protein (DUF885 family)